MRTPSTAVLAVFAVLGAAGCGHDWTVLRASGPPSALRGARTFAIASDFSGVHVEGEGAAGERTPEENVHDAMLAGLRAESPGRALPAAEAGTGPDVVLVAVKYVHIDPGVITPFAGKRDARVTARVRFIRGGHDLDEIELTVASRAHVDLDPTDAGGHGTKNGRLRLCGRQLGWRIARFLTGATK